MSEVSKRLKNHESKMVVSFVSELEKQISDLQIENATLENRIYEMTETIPHIDKRVTEFQTLKEFARLFYEADYPVNYKSQNDCDVFYYEKVEAILDRAGSSNDNV